MFLKLQLYVAQQTCWKYSLRPLKKNTISHRIYLGLKIFKWKTKYHRV